MLSESNETTINDAEIVTNTEITPLSNSSIDAIVEDILQTHNHDIVNETNDVLEDITVTSVTEENTPTEIPVNSETLLIDTTTSRFSSATWYDRVKQQDITLAGIGGIGSFTAFMLSRLKPSYIWLYDDDMVETANLSGQLYGMNHLHEYKVNALYRICTRFSNYSSIYCNSSKYNADSMVTDIMICGFDNMKARKVFFKNWENHVKESPIEKQKECLFIDGRLNAEEFQVLCIKGDDAYNMNRYKQEFLFNDNEVSDNVCSYKQTTFCASMIASVITNLFVNFCANFCDPIIERDLPFFTYYNASTMFLKTER